MFSGAASTFGGPVATAFFFILGVCVFMLVLITLLMVFFTVKYSRKRNPTPVNIEGNTLLEITWTVVPTLLVLAMFYFGWIGYRQMVNVPKDAITIKVTGRQWSWLFEYENGRQSDKLMVPVNRPVLLKLFSADVLHSFYVPAFRIKKDVVPGGKNTVWFRPDEIGTYDVFCAEYCGTGHSSMLTKVVVVSDQDYTSWLEGKRISRGEEAEPEGKKLLRLKGCRGCHTIDGSRLVGPTFKGVFGRTEHVMTGGVERTLVIDEAYLRRSMLEPKADVVVGYPPVMPSQKGILTEKEIAEIIEYLKTLK